MKSTLLLAAVPVALLSFSQIVAAASSQDHFANGPIEDSRHHGHDDGHHNKKPNFLVFLTDDQDRRMNSLDHLPLVKKYIRDEGTEFTNYYTTTATCCPSRVSLWSGQFAHNHNVTDESAPHGMSFFFFCQADCILDILSNRVDF